MTPRNQIGASIMKQVKPKQNGSVSERERKFNHSAYPTHKIFFLHNDICNIFDQYLCPRS